MCPFWALALDRRSDWTLFGPSLSAIASEHFAFEDAVRGRGDGSDGGEVSWEQRLTRLGSGMLRVQESCRPC